MSTITVEHVARIEGHGTIAVEVEGDRVKDVRMDIVEASRFFESMVVGRRYDDVSLITSRICGICSPSHAVTALKAVEDAFGIEVSARTEALRKLLIYGSYLQNHATHLYVFAAPDFVCLPSVFPLAATNPDILERALLIKKTGNDLTTLIGGRPVHPVTAVVGGFTSEPGTDELKAMSARLKDLVDDAVATARLFHSFAVPEFATEGDMLALANASEYGFYDGQIGALESGIRRPVADYRDVIIESVVSHSNAKHSTHNGRTFMVGALPRLSISAGLLMPRAASIADELALAANAKNSFLNNAAQAVELVDACERCAAIIDEVLVMGSSSAPEPVVPRAGRGVAATEAPRGTVYHGYTFDANGIVTAGDVITPTAQNLGNLDADMRALAPSLVGLSKEEFLFMMEKLVRAYDPCLSCSVH